MLEICFIWDLAEEPAGNVQHISQHGVSVDEAEEVVLNRESAVTTSRSSGNRVTFGYTAEGRYLAVVWEHVDDHPLTIRVVTAYDAPEPGSKSKPRKKRR